MSGADSPPAALRPDLIWVLALLAVLSVPFWGKAFHIDDAFFLAVAENVRRDPLRPFAGAAALDDIDRRVFGRLGTAPNTFETLSHPPLVPCVIAAVAAAGGGAREWPEHAAFFGFALLAACSQYQLARRFTSRPWVAALCLVSSPIFLVSSHSLMTDVPALALSLAALAAFVRGSDAGHTGQLLLAGLLAGLALLTRYVAFGLLPLGVAYVVLKRRPARKAALALLPMAAVWGAWCVQNWLTQGTLHLAASLRHYVEYYGSGAFAGSELAARAISDLSALGGAAFAFVPLLLAAGRRSVAVFAACLAAAAALCGADVFGLEDLRDYSVNQRIALSLSFGAGAFLLCEATRRSWSASRDAAFLWLWLAGGCLASVCLLPFGAARYMLPVLPPLALILSSPQPGLPGRRPLWVGLSFAVTMVLGGMLAAADAEFAAVYRRAARELPAASGGGRVWFIADWGFRYYMERDGHRYLLSTDQSPTEGDVVIVPRIAGLHAMAPAVQARARLERAIDVPGTLPLRVLNGEAKAGFYSHGWGLLPFAFSRSPLEHFDVYRLGPAAD